MVIKTKDETFLFRVFANKGKKRLNFHDGAKDKEYQYDETWRLAPRNELISEIRTFALYSFPRLIP